VGSVTGSLRLSIWGAAETVTGSRFLVETSSQRLLVDCGLFQGVKRLRERNWQRFPVDPASIDAVVLTHAHIDHSGYLPALVRDGFRGPIWCTPSTLELAEILLLDSAHLHEEEARHANRRRSSKHHPALPLYTQEDARRALGHLRGRPVGEVFVPAPGLEARFTSAGHILGAASVWLSDGVTSIAFTGDVGRPTDPVMRPPQPLPAADHVVTESTYGNRNHPPDDSMKVLASIVNETARRGGTLLVPVFAVGRAQTVLHLLARLRADGRIPRLPTYLNSPMAVHATDLFCRHAGEHRLTPEDCEALRDGVELVTSVEDSKRLTRQRGPAIVLSASGMASGGRVLHHLEQLAPDPRNTILFTGFQAAGTRGEALTNGARAVKVFGAYVPVRARVENLTTLSAHADGDELVDFLGATPIPRLGATIVHGEPAAADALRRLLRDRLGWRAQVAEHGQRIELGTCE
jgi:metallo-beta-lactamase family protein